MTRALNSTHVFRVHVSLCHSAASLCSYCEPYHLKLILKWVSVCLRMGSVSFSQPGAVRH